MGKINGVAAAAWLRAQGALAHDGACLHYVWQAYKAQGASTGRHAGTALEAWNKTERRHPGDRNPPVGVPVWFGAKAGSAAGDVVISLGGGKVVATDYPRYGVVGVCTIAQRQAQIGRPYLGWSEAIFDQQIAIPTPASGGGSSVAPAPQKKEEEEEDMIIIIQRANSQLAKGRLLPSGRTREITPAENAVYRSLEGRGAAEFVTVSDKVYENLLSGSKATV
ncbi:hypothetical protein [Microbacterium sp. B19(2022)]|uniref:hypothetical protein n=1 Tax=Microbacterium sp. B19(2022) TaxID=2914045 RepID=UPI00197BE55B|nr:hypothetical protein [Microbacterium sp. B19(2022)]